MIFALIAFIIVVALAIYAAYFWSIDMSTVGLPISIIAIFLLVSSQVLSTCEGKTTVLINKEKLRNVAITTMMVFFVTVAVKIMTMVGSPATP